MGIIEDIGETVIDIMTKAVYHTLGLLIKGIKVGDAFFQKLKVVSFYPVFERRGVEYRDYVILKAQVTTLLFVLVAVVYIFRGLSALPLTLLLAVSGGVSIYLIFTDIKEHFADDFYAYRDFFLSYLAISLLLIGIKGWKPVIDFPFPFAHLFLFSLLAIGVMSAAFKNKYGRDFTTGRVLEAGERIKVKLNYDIRASVKPGVYTFDNVTGAKVGDMVKLKVEKGFWNLRGKKPVGVIKEENG